MRIGKWQNVILVIAGLVGLPPAALHAQAPVDLSQRAVELTAMLPEKAEGAGPPIDDRKFWDELRKSTGWSDVPVRRSACCDDLLRY